MNGTLFYIFGLTLTATALLVTVAGLKSERFPGRALPLVALWMVVLVGGTTTFAVLHARDTQAENAAHEQEATLPGGEEASQDAVH